jgi:FAD/FMN-containing dehydrogenase
MGRVAPHLVVQDAVVPRTQLAPLLEEIHAIGAASGLRVCNVFHAGDGNLHPNIPYDANDPDEAVRVHRAMRAIMERCIAAGGTITGEHGVGLDKLPVHGSALHGGDARRDVRAAGGVRPGPAGESRQGGARACVQGVARGGAMTGARRASGSVRP